MGWMGPSDDIDNCLSIEYSSVGNDESELQDDGNGAGISINGR